MLGDLVHEGAGAGRPETVLQRGDLKVHGLAAVAGVGLDLVEGLLHGLDDGSRLILLADELADHVDGGVDTFNILRVAHDDMHARSLQLLDLLVGLGHGTHEQDLRLQLDDLLDVGVAAGLDSRDLGHFRRIVAVFAAGRPADRPRRWRRGSRSLTGSGRRYGSRARPG